jgi:hypothetical protein
MGPVKDIMFPATRGRLPERVDRDSAVDIVGGEEPGD